MMRNLRIALLIVAGSMAALAQSGTNPPAARTIRAGASLPATCTPGSGNVFFKTSATIGLYQCLTVNTWTAVGSGSGGSIAGDVTGTLAASTVVKINGTALSGLATGLLKNTVGTGVPFISKVALTEPATGATITPADNSSLITVGAFASTFTFSGTTGVTFPTSGTLATTTDSNFVKGAANLTTTGAIPFQNGITGTVTQAAGLSWVSPLLSVPGTVQTTDGSASLPAFKGTDADSGLYFSGNNIRFTVDGTNTFLVDGGGVNMTIGGYYGFGNASAASAGRDTTLCRSAAGVITFGTTICGTAGSWSATNGTLSGTGSAALYATATNCSSSAAPAVCSAAAAGSVVVAAAATTVVVNTTAVTANSQIILIYDSSLGTKLGVTCNTTEPALYGVTARTAATSFTITATAPVTNPACFSYLIIN